MTELVQNEASESPDHFTPKQVFRHVKAMVGYLQSQWKKILLITLIFGFAAFIYSFLKTPDYVAEMTFSLDEGAGSSAKERTQSLPEQFMLGAPTDAGSIFSSMTNILELMKSRLLIEKTLRNSIYLNGKASTFADFFLDSLKYREKWVKDKKKRKPDFTSTRGSKEDSLFRNGLLFNIYQILTTKVIKVDQKGQSTTIVSTTCTSKNELFSKSFLEAWVNEVIRFYIDTKTERAKISLNFILKRTDSVRITYYNALLNRAAFADETINPIRQTASISAEKRQTDIQILRESYIELQHSVESAKTTLLRDTPLIQYIDVPILPLGQLSSDVKKLTLIGMVAGFFIGISWLLARRLLHYLNN